MNKVLLFLLIIPFCSFSQNSQWFEGPEGIDDLNCATLTGFINNNTLRYCDENKSLKTVKVWKSLVNYKDQYGNIRPNYITPIGFIDNIDSKIKVVESIKAKINFIRYNVNTNDYSKLFIHNDDFNESYQSELDFFKKLLEIKDLKTLKIAEDKASKPFSFSNTDLRNSNELFYESIYEKYIEIKNEIMNGQIEGLIW